MQKFTFFFLFLALHIVAFAQTAADYCDGSRYQTEVFTAFSKATDVVYGQNIRYNGATQVLKMDIYQPTGDNATARPLLILAHGGSFIGGAKTDGDVSYWGNHFAKQGFVVASIDYRVGLNIFSLDSIEVLTAVVRAVHDMRACVRYFRKDAQATNTYKIDPNMIIIGGSSAGAITALHTAYLNTMSETPAYLQTIMNTLGGGLEGNSGNPGFNSVPNGVLNGSGAIGEKTWIEAGDIPICSVHGTDDGTVPYGTELQYLPGTTVAVSVVDGSGSIHPYATSIGTESTLKTFNGAGHVPYLSGGPYMDTTMQYFTTFLVNRICTPNAIAASLSDNSLSIYPNPAMDKITFEVKLPSSELTIYDLSGKSLFQANYNEGKHEVSLAGLTKGMYIVNIKSEGKQFSQKLVVSE